MFYYQLKKTMSKKKDNFDCESCKTNWTFFMHTCSQSIQECYGCLKCDSWCTKCKKDWANVKKKENVNV